MMCFKVIKKELIEKYDFTPYSLGVSKVVGVSILIYNQKGFYIRNLNDVRSTKISKDKFYGFLANS